MRNAWTGTSKHSARPEHAVRVYRDAAELAEPVCDFLAAGFELGDPALVLATPENRERFAERLAEEGWEAAELETRGLLVDADAERTLAALMDGERPSPAGFEQVVGGLLDRAGERAPGRPVRVFGEMVDLLCRRDDPESALELEALWNRLGRRRRFSLLCAYQLDVFDRAAQVSMLPAVCRAHTHVHAAGDAARLHWAVDRALEEALGSNAGKVYALIGEQIRERRVPPAQLALMWVSANMPALAGRILASARLHYLREPAPQS